MNFRTMTLFVIAEFIALPVVTPGAELVRFEEIENVPRNGDVLATAVSADGSVVVLDQLGGPAWTWTKADGVQRLAAVIDAFPDHQDFLTVGTVSNDGTYVAGGAGDGGSFVYNRTTNEMDQMEGIGWIRPFDFSADASVVVGWHNTDAAFDFQQAFRWSREEGLVDLGVPDGWVSSQAGAVSSDGLTIVGGLTGDEIKDERGRGIGHTANDGFVWRQGEFVELGLPGDAVVPKRALDISDDGSVVVAFADDQLFRWESTSRTLTALGRLDGFDGFQGWWNEVDMSADGEVIIGNAINREPGTASIVDRAGFVWDTAHGMRNLTEVLRDEHGLIYPEERGFESPRGISQDKKVIVGWTQGPHGHRAWAVYLDGPLVVTSGVTGDFNGNAELDLEDLDLLTKELLTDRNLDLFDVNTDGLVNNTDVTQWLSDAATEHGFAEPYFLGDANLDGVINVHDLNAVGFHWLQDVALWSAGDFTADGKVDAADLNALGQNWLKEVVTAEAAAVPEPSTWALVWITFGAVMMSRSFDTKGSHRVG